MVSMPFCPILYRFNQSKTQKCGNQYLFLIIKPLSDSSTMRTTFGRVNIMRQSLRTSKRRRLSLIGLRSSSKTVKLDDIFYKEQFLMTRKLTPDGLNSMNFSLSLNSASTLQHLLKGIDKAIDSPRKPPTITFTYPSISLIERQTHTVPINTIAIAHPPIVSFLISIFKYCFYASYKLSPEQRHHPPYHPIYKIFWRSFRIKFGFTLQTKLYLNKIRIKMDDPEENIDPEEQQEYEQPAEQQENIQMDSDDEDEFPEFGNDENKKLFELIRQKKRYIKKINKEFEKDHERKKILEEHLKNVDQELLNTKALIDSKNKETETENHLWQVTERQSGRLESEIKKFNKVVGENQERLNDIQVRIFRVNEKVEQIKLELNWNQEELEQWAITGKQKEEDHVTLQKYRKEDDTKIRQLNLQIEKLTIEVGRKQQQLDKEITSTQATQIELDKSAEQFKKEHDERHKLFEKWQDVTTTIARRDDDIMRISEDVGEVMDLINQNKEILDEKKRQLEDQKRLNKDQEAMNVMANRDISEKKNQNKRLEFEVIANLRAEVEILKNQLSSFSTEWANKRNLVNIKNQELLQKKQRLQIEEAKFNAYSIKLKNELKLAEKFENAKAIAESTYKDKQTERKRIEQQIELQKDISVRSTQGLFKLREEEASLYGEIQGIMAACRNLQSHINKLNQEFQKQQELLYNAEYQIQLMERKVARAKGERTLEEKKDLQKDIEEAAKKNTDIKNQYKILNESVKKLNDDLRAVENSLNDIKASEKKLNSQIEQLSLENDMTIQDLSKVTKKKEEVLVQHDIMKLEIKKIKESLNRATDHVYGLENKKNQLEMSMQERQKEIYVHRDVLLAEQKAIEDERHRIAIELAERKNKVKNLRIKYESMVQKAHSSEDGEAEHSQAYYVIKASQEREELQRKGDELSGKINEAEKKLKGLQNTYLALANSNTKFAQKIGNKGVSKSDLAQKQALEEQCNAASENLFKKKNELKKLEQEYEQDAKRLTETLNRKQTLEERKGKLEHVIFKQNEDLNQLQEKKGRAEKSLNLMQANWNKKKIEVKEDNPHLAQLQYEIEVDKNKTLIQSLKNLGEDLPDLGPLIDDFLKDNNIDMPSKAPSSVDMLSSHGSVSVRSGGSAISRASKMSKK